jgi:hypothetical protein
MKNIPYITNSKEIRILLEKNGYTSLSFFQGKQFVFPIISTWGNKFGKWKEKDYSTTDNILNKSYLNSKESSFSEFIEWIENHGN